MADTLSARRFKRIAAVAFVGAAALTSFHSGVAAPKRVRPVTYPTPYGAIAPAGLSIPVVLVTQINSATFKIGDRFEFKTAKDMKIGELTLPKNTLGHGRLSNVVRATNKHNGDVSVQADAIDLPNGLPLWVNVDPKTRIDGHLADKHTRFLVLVISTDYSGNMVLEPGTPFNVLTIARRAGVAPLITSNASPLPGSSAPAAVASALPGGSVGSPTPSMPSAGASASSESLLPIPVTPAPHDVPSAAAKPMRAPLLTPAPLRSAH